MDKFKKIIICSEIGLAIALIIDSFVRNILSSFLITIILAAAFIVMALISDFEFGKKNHTRDALITISIIVSSYYIVIYLFGITTGFYENQYSLEAYSIFKSLLRYGTYIVSCELFRYAAIRKMPKSKFNFAILVLILTLCDVSDHIFSCNLTDVSDTIALLGYDVVPSIIKNIALTFVALKISYLPNIFYRFCMELPAYFLPFIPDTGIYIQSFLNIVLPAIVFSYFWNNFKEKSKDSKPKPILAALGMMFRCMMTAFILILTYLVCGFFKYQLVAIGSESMTPTILKGDGVIIKKLNSNEIKRLKVGDIIALNNSGIIVTHRITQVNNSEDGITFHTKGDSNTGEDAVSTRESDVRGIVVHVIPKIGSPTVWLRGLKNY